MIIVGAGNIGRAVALSDSFPANGFETVAIFDNDAAKIGMTVGSLVVQDVEDLKRYLDENTVDIAVIAVPVSHAQRMVEVLCERGVKGFWNFAPLDLKVPDGTSVVNVHLDEGLEILSFRMLRELA